MKLENFVNVGMLRQPLNWVIVPLIVLFTLQLMTILYASTQPKEG